MDIVSRLKKFMDAEKISNSQFADSCNIPRPTVSQILNGRNKKISDELISKIHVAFPNLSVLWLMFGEGSMTNGANIAISEPQIQTELQFDDSQNAEHEIHTSDRIEFQPVQKKQPENSRVDFVDSSVENRSKKQIDFNDDEPKPTKVTGINVKMDSYKKIKNIIVLFEDDSALTFVPSTSN